MSPGKRQGGSASANDTQTISYEGGGGTKLGEVMIKTPKIFFSISGFYHLGSLGIYFDKDKKIDQKCSIGGADGNFTGFC